MSKHAKQPGQHRDPYDRVAMDKPGRAGRHTLPGGVSGGMVEALRSRDAQQRNHQAKHQAE